MRMRILIVLHMYATILLVPILKDTWGKEAGDSICYYSEIEDTAAGTTSLGIPNIESGKYSLWMLYTFKVLVWAKIKQITVLLFP